jgi:hypothetical protein
MLSSPIILYDYPQIAPESPGDLFDATEIDEILTLRILSLTEDEKQAMAAVDERARALLQRTESLAQEQMIGLHGTIRGLRVPSVGAQSSRHTRCAELAPAVEAGTPSVPATLRTDSSGGGRP